MSSGRVNSAGCGGPPPSWLTPSTGGLARVARAGPQRAFVAGAPARAEALFRDSGRRQRLGAPPEALDTDHHLPAEGPELEVADLGRDPAALSNAALQDVHEHAVSRR